MAMNGLQIQKLLPKTNCKECGSNTCLAFAMKLAGKKAELSECPYVSDEARAILGADSEPPMRTVTIGSGATAFKAGGETVLFRHEKTFVNPTGLGLAVDDTLADAELESRVRALADYLVVRVGEELRPTLITVTCASGHAERLLAAVARVRTIWGDRPLAVRADEPAILKAAAEALSGQKILLASASRESAAELAAIAQQHGHALAIAAETFDDLCAGVEAAVGAGCRELFLELRADSLAEHYQNRTIIRRGALKAGLKTLGYPTLKFIATGNAIDDALEAGLEITKYGALAVLPEFDPATWMPLLALRQNIYTDPQKPIQVEPRVYAIGEPTAASPVFVTTNFSLTYFIVSGEIENAGLSAWLVIPECEGMSVLTAWAAGKFGGAKIGQAIKESELAATQQNKKVIIPGYVAQISGELEEALPGWQIIVGPQEAGDLEGFVKSVLSAA